MNIHKIHNLLIYKNLFKKFLIVQIFLSNLLIQPLKSFYSTDSYKNSDGLDQILISEIEWKPIKNFKKKGILKWEKSNTEEEIDFSISNVEKRLATVEKYNNLNSLNRSIVFDNEIIGPDIGWLVPPGFQWNNKYKFDLSVRGHNRRDLKKGDPFLGWNGGDAVGQFYYHPLFNEKYSFGINIGARSVYEGNAVGGTTPIGEGLSMGFRLDRKLSNNSGFAIGAEQLIHFDGLTDTGRDLYITLSKGWWQNNKKGQFPLKIATFGFGTGKLAEGNIKGFCSSLFGGSGTEIAHQRALCWAPIFTLARVHNSKLSTFFEYNSKWFLLGTSISPYQKIPLRGTFAVQLSDHVDNYKLNNFNEAKWVFRLSLGF